MITRILGLLNKIVDDKIRLQVGALEYELLVSEATRISLESRIGQEVMLHTRHYLEAGAMQSAIHPRLIGFETEHELEFFDLICTVDKIGVRKALGARRQDILMQFLIESATLSFAGGVTGVVAGIVVAKIITFAISFPSAVQFWSILVSLLVSASVGLFFGIWPANKAARLDPVVALRYE